MLRSWRSFGVRTVAVFAALLAVMAATGQQAYAASGVMKDAKGDTYRPTGQHDEHLVHKPSVNGDITSVRTTHGAKAVTITVHARKLRLGFDAVVVQLKTSAAHHSRFVVTGAMAKGYRDVELTGAANRKVPCSALRVRPDTAQDLVRIHVPRRCIGNPAWVRTGAALFRSRVDQPGDWKTVDVAGKKVLTDRWWTGSGHLPVGPRVRR